MGKFKEYGQYDGLGLAELIRKGEVSEADVYEAAMERIETLIQKLMPLSPIWRMKGKRL